LETLQKNPSQKRLFNYIEETIKASNVEVDFEAKERLLLYFSQLFLWNKSKNLTGIKEPSLMVYKHLGDTLILFRHQPNAIETMLDIGTGQGVPGLLIKILKPQLKVSLADASKKKCSFLRFIIALLNLRNIKVSEKRITAQEPPSMFEDKAFDLIVSQATGTLSWLVRTARPFLKENGHIIALKGPKGIYEVEELRFLYDKKQPPKIEIIDEQLPLLNQKRLLISIQFHN